MGYNSIEEYRLIQYLENNPNIWDNEWIVPVINPKTGGIYCKCMPNPETYLQFERQHKLKKSAMRENRSKYNIKQEDLKCFEDCNDYNFKDAKKESNKHNVMKAYNISREDSDYMCTLFKELFDTDKECFVTLRCAETGQMYSYNVQSLKDSDKLFNILNSNKFRKEDFFYSIATYNKMASFNENDIFSMHMIVIDVDYKKVKKLKNKTPIEIFELLQATEFEKSIPTPNYVEAGNQIKLIYKIETVGATKPSKTLVKRLNTVFNQKMADFGGDTPRLTDYNRIKGSVNTKNNAVVDIFIIETAPTYTISELKDKWLDELPAWYPMWNSRKKTKSNGTIVQFRQHSKALYPLNMGRIEDFKRIRDYYGKELDGRRFLCFMVRNHAKLAGLSDAEAEQMMREFNQLMANPLQWRVIERDTRNVNKKQYLYSDITILDELGLDADDVSRIGLETLQYITKEEREEKRNQYRKEYDYMKYRNTEGLTKQEVKRRTEFIKIAQMELEGLSLNAIAKKLGKDKGGLSRKLNKQYDTVNYTEIKNMVEKLQKDGIKILA